MKKHMVCVLGRMLFIGMSIQIVLGILWLITNFTSMQEFGDTYIYIEVSRSLRCDEYIGILYPLILSFLRVPGELMGLTWYPFLYLLQLTAGFFASFYLVTALLDKKTQKYSLPWRLWAALGIFTIPAVMQCHLAILPNSFTVSIYLVMVALGVYELRSSENLRGAAVAKLGVLWLVTALLMPEYGFLGGVLLFTIIVWKLFLGRKLEKTKGSLVYPVIVFVAFVGIVGSVPALTQSSGALGRAQDSLALRTVSRFVWPNFQNYHSAWPYEITDVISWDEAGEICRRADGVTAVFAPMMEEAVGAEKAKEAYWKLAKTALHILSKDIAGKVLWDGTCHVFSPYMLTEQLEGRGYQSYSGRNYEVMKAQTPALTKLYVSYEGWWFVTGIGLAVVLTVATGWRGRKYSWQEAGFLMINALLMAGYFTMSGAGIMDYKQTNFVTILWILWFCSLACNHCIKGIDNS